MCFELFHSHVSRVNRYNKSEYWNQLKFLFCRRWIASSKYINTLRISKGLWHESFPFNSHIFRKEPLSNWNPFTCALLRESYSARLWFTATFVSDACGGERWRWWHACVRVCVRDSIKDAGIKVGGGWGGRAAGVALVWGWVGGMGDFRLKDWHIMAPGEERGWIRKCHLMAQEE